MPADPSRFVPISGDSASLSGGGGAKFVAQI
jgi:hypothetical protein